MHNRLSQACLSPDWCTCRPLHCTLTLLSGTINRGNPYQQRNVFPSALILTPVALHINTSRFTQHDKIRTLCNTHQQACLLPIGLRVLCSLDV